MNVVLRPPLKPPPARRRRVKAWIKATALLLVSLLVEVDVFPVLPSGDNSSAAAREQDYTWTRWAQIAALIVLIVGVMLVLLVKMAAHWG